MNLSATIAKMRAAGMSSEAILLALECLVVDQTPERSGAARRQAAYRERQKHNALRNVDNGDGEMDANKGFDKERFHTSKEITSKQNTPSSADEETKTLIWRICEVVACIPGPLPDDATACHDAVEAALKADGLRVIREAEVRNGDGITGRFDLLVMFAGGRVAIEIDRRLARAKSTQKLLGFDGGRIQILRGSMPPHEIPGIDATLSLPVIHGEKSERGELPDDWEPDGKTWKLAGQLGFTSQEAWDQLERMRDWAKNAGAKGHKSDWNAAFRNWLKRTADERRSKPQASRRNNLHDSLAVLDAVTDEAIRRAGGYGPEGSEENPDLLPGLRKSAA